MVGKKILEGETTDASTSLHRQTDYAGCTPIAMTGISMFHSMMRSVYRKRMWLSMRRNLGFLVESQCRSVL